MDEVTKLAIGVDLAAGPDQSALLLVTRKYEIRPWAKVLPTFVRRFFRYRPFMWKMVLMSVHNHLPTCDTQFVRLCPANKVLFDEQPTQHWWSGWPGAICLKCGDEDKVEVCVGNSCKCPCHDVMPMVGAYDPC